jgi:peptide-methionine (R)-S-oxide reductase
VKIKTLNTEEANVILKKGTEPPFTGKYDLHFEDGSYTCKQCRALLFKSENKFKSGCGWPSFDESINDAIKEVPDADGRRTEIVCKQCDAHLGHVFRGEGYTNKDTRHCVNSISIEFTKSGK